MEVGGGPDPALWAAAGKRHRRAGRFTDTPVTVPLTCDDPNEAHGAPLAICAPRLKPRGAHARQEEVDELSPPPASIFLMSAVTVLDGIAKPRPTDPALELLPEDEE
jgi:hypothetical protein